MGLTMLILAICLVALIALAVVAGVLFWWGSRSDRD